MKPTRIHAGAGVLALALAGAAAAGVATHAGTRTSTVRVTEREFRIVLSPRKVQPGTTRFVIVNKGRDTHALELSGPGVKPRRTGLIRPGKTARLTVQLAAGTYTVWCPVPGHAARGMKTRLTVAGAAAAAPVATTTTAGTTTSSGGGGEAWG